MSAWNDFVKKIYWEGKKKNPNYKFKQALQDASKRKSEMGSTPSMSSKNKKYMSKSRCESRCKSMCKSKKYNKRSKNGTRRRR